MEAASIIGPVKASYRLREADLADITPERVLGILRGVRNGRLDDLERLNDAMFESWPRLQKNVAEVSKAVSRLEFSVIPHAEKGEDPTPEAQAMADLVEFAIWKARPSATEWETDFIGLIKACLDAYARSHVVTEMLWHTVDWNGKPVHCPRAYAPIPARYWGYPNYSGESLPDRLMLNPTGMLGGQLEDFPQDKFIIAKWQRGSEHPIKSGNLRALSKYWLGAYFGLGWLLQYAQLFGIPWRTIETDGSNAANLAAMEALQNLGAVGWGVLPKGTTLTVHDAPSGGESIPQKLVLDLADEACDIMFLGQTLTTTQGDKGSHALGSVHSAMRDDQLAAAADWVCGVIGNQLIPALIRQNFGPDAANGPMPYIVAKMPETRDEKAVIERLKGIRDLGVPVSAQYVHDELGLPILADGDEAFEFAKIAVPAMGPNGEAQAEEENQDPEQLEAARKGPRGKRPSGPKLSVWQRRSGVISRR